jgi:hypothetical protein
VTTRDRLDRPASFHDKRAAEAAPQTVGRLWTKCRFDRVVHRLSVGGRIAPRLSHSGWEAESLEVDRMRQGADVVDVSGGDTWVRTPLVQNRSGTALSSMTASQPASRTDRHDRAMHAERTRSALLEARRGRHG